MFIEQLPLLLRTFDSVGATGEGGIELIHHIVGLTPQSATLQWLMEVMFSNFLRCSDEKEVRDKKIQGTI